MSENDYCRWNDDGVCTEEKEFPHPCNVDECPYLLNPELYEYADFDGEYFRYNGNWYRLECI